MHRIRRAFADRLLTFEQVMVPARLRVAPENVPLALVVELVYMLVLEASAERIESSNLSECTRGTGKPVVSSALYVCRSKDVKL